MEVVKTVKIESQELLTSLRRRYATLAGLDEIKVNDSVLFRAGLTLLDAYLEAMTRQRKAPGFWSVSLHYLSKGWFDKKGFPWKQSKADLILSRELSADLMQEMMKILGEDVTATVGPENR